ITSSAISESRCLSALLGLGRSWSGGSSRQSQHFSRSYKPSRRIGQPTCRPYSTARRERSRRRSFFSLSSGDGDGASRLIVGKLGRSRLLSPVLPTPRKEAFPANALLIWQTHLR